MKWIKSLLFVLFIAACTPQAVPPIHPEASVSPVATLITSSPTAGLQPIPSPTVTPPPKCQSVEGTVLSKTLADADGNEFHFRVYLPPCYPMAAPCYPTLYLLHGLASDESQWLDLGLVTTVDKLRRAGEMPPLIIILPRDPDIRQPGQSVFDEWLLDVLLPWVDRHYQTCPERRGLGGISRGGAWAVHLGLMHPDLFRALGWHSPEIFWGDDLKIPGWLANLPPDAHLQVYLDAGNSDTSLPRARWLEEQLRTFGVPYEWHLTVGYHEEKLWRAHLLDYLRWYGQVLSP